MYEGVRVHFPDPWTAEKALRQMKQEWNPRLSYFWAGSELDALRNVELIATIVLVGIGLLTILAGSISVFNTLRASVAHKTREIGILRALGVTRMDVFTIFISQSVFIAVLAAGIGLAAAWLAAARLNAMVSAKWEELGAELEKTGGLFVLPPAAVGGIFAAVLLICLGAAFLPSWQAARKTPMDALNTQGP
jgi:putative ABC transport system permease protein